MLVQMNSRVKTTTGALAGAVVLASGAYGLGTQNDDGSAAAGTAAQERAEAGPRTGAIAKRLGVEAAKLRSALGELRSEREGSRGDRRKNFAAELAGELDIETAKVQAALERLQEKHQDEFEARHQAFTAALAKKLDIPVKRVREVLSDGPRQGRHGGRLGGDGPGGRQHGPQAGAPPLQ